MKPKKLTKLTAKTKKPKAKPKTPQTTQLAVVWAVNGSTRFAPKHMPKKVVVSLEGDAKKGALFVNGWSVAPDESFYWPKTRLENYLKRILLDWRREYGLGWKLSIENV